MNNIVEINKKIINIECKITNLENKLESIEEKLDKLLRISNKMDDHIEFVEHSYSIIRGPLNYLKNKINLLSGFYSFSSEDLPMINYNNNNDNI